jgi:membrane protease YdiL (CAAX protease family)
MADESDNNSFDSRHSKVLDSIRETFEGVPTDLSAEQKSVGASDKTWVSWLIILTFSAVWWIVGIIGFLAIYLVLFIAEISEGLAISISLLLTEIILIPLVLLYIYVDGSLDRIKEMLRFGSVKRTLILILAIPIVVTIIDFFLTMVYGIAWIGIFGEPSTNTDLGTDWGSSSIDIAFLFLSVAIVTPIAEELFFRGYVLDAINRKHGDWTAIIWSAMLFGLVHLDPFTVGQAFMGGIMYGWIRMRTGSLLPSIACHMIWNILALVVTYL